MICVEKVNSIGIPQQQHPFVEKSRYSLAEEPYLKKEVILTALVVVGVALVVFSAFACPPVCAAILGVIVLVAPVGAFFLDKKWEEEKKLNSSSSNSSLQTAIKGPSASSLETVKAPVDVPANERDEVVNHALLRTTPATTPERGAVERATMIEASFSGASFLPTSGIPLKGIWWHYYNCGPNAAMQLILNDETLLNNLEKKFNDHRDDKNITDFLKALNGYKTDARPENIDFTTPLGKMLNLKGSAGRDVADPMDILSQLADLKKEVSFHQAAIVCPAATRGENEKGIDLLKKHREYNPVLDRFFNNDSELGGFYIRVNHEDLLSKAAIDMQEALHNNVGEYALRSIVVHKSEHFFALVRRSRQEPWMKADSDKITVATKDEIEEALNRSGYVYFYDLKK